jgi:hypothetical protein
MTLILFRHKKRNTKKTKTRTRRKRRIRKNQRRVNMEEMTKKLVIMTSTPKRWKIK